MLDFRVHGFGSVGRGITFLGGLQQVWKLEQETIIVRVQVSRLGWGLP